MDEKQTRLLADEILQWRLEHERASIFGLRVTSFERDETPLCKEYFWGTNLCTGCPISEHTQKKCCFGTPLDRICAAVVNKNLPEYLAAIQAHLDFLTYLKDASYENR